MLQGAQEVAVYSSLDVGALGLFENLLHISEIRIKENSKPTMVPKGKNQGEKKKSKIKNNQC